MTTLVQSAIRTSTTRPGTTTYRFSTFARAAAAIGVTISADVHFELWDDGGFRSLHIVGPLFLLNAISGLIIAFAVICWRHWLSAAAAAGFGAATVLAFWISVVHGLFGVHETGGGLSEVLAEVAEIVAFVGAAVAVYLELRQFRSTPKAE